MSSKATRKTPQGTQKRIITGVPHNDAPLIGEICGVRVDPAISISTLYRSEDKRVIITRISKRQHRLITINKEHRHIYEGKLEPLIKIMIRHFH